MRWCGCDHSGFDSCMPGESECWLLISVRLCPLLEAWRWSAVVSSLFVDLKKKKIIIKDALVFIFIFSLFCFCFFFFSYSPKDSNAFHSGGGILIKCVIQSFAKVWDRTRFSSFLCYDIRLFNFMFLLHHPIWVEEEYKQRKEILESMWEKTKNTTTTKTF